MGLLGCSTVSAAASTSALNAGSLAALASSAAVIVAACAASTVSTMSPPAAMKSTARSADRVAGDLRCRAEVVADHDAA